MRDATQHTASTEEIARAATAAAATQPRSLALPLPRGLACASGAARLPAQPLADATAAAEATDAPRAAKPRAAKATKAAASADTAVAKTAAP
jgi:hypothetical protein